jgi:hypothetical protein
MRLVSIALYVFSLAFLVAGITRVAEFSGVGIKDALRRVLMVAHVIGCVLFSGVFALLGIDEHSGLIGPFLAASLIILFPVHIYLGIKRRIAIRDRSQPTEGEQ